MKSAVISKELAVDAAVTLLTSSTSEPINVGYAEYFSIHAQISGTAPDVKVEVEITNSQAGDRDLVGKEPESAWISPSTGGTIKASASSNFADGFTVPVCKWMRIKVTGINANTSATCKIYIMYQ
jgi:hypothetical protein